MTERTIKIPNADHPITIESNPRRVVVTVNGQVLADSRRALTLKEAKYPAVLYIPRGDANMAALTRSAHTTYCPFKGDCSYYNLPGDTERSMNAVWTYEDPFPAVELIKEYIAFYLDRVSIVETTD